MKKWIEVTHEHFVELKRAEYDIHTKSSTCSQKIWSSWSSMLMISMYDVLWIAWESVVSSDTICMQELASVQLKSALDLCFVSEACTHL